MRKKAFLPTLLLGTTLVQITAPAAMAGGGGNVPCGPGSVNTLIGCLPFTNFGSIAETLFSLVAESVAAIAIIAFIAGAYQAMVSGDNPIQLQEAKQRMTMAIAGYFLLLLFVGIIQVLGVQLLGITPLQHVVAPWN
jgi:hypothetical protein